MHMTHVYIYKLYVCTYLFIRMHTYVEHHWNQKTFSCGTPALPCCAVARPAPVISWRLSSCTRRRPARSLKWHRVAWN